MKLYEVPNKTMVQTKEGYTYFFDHIDGMYSYCTNENGQVLHLQAWEEVEIVG